MVGFDTNVLIRVLVGDDPAQTRRAERAFSVHADGPGLFVSLLVLAELSWVLTGTYGWDRGTVHDRLSRLIRTRGVVVEDVGLVQRALDTYLDSKAGFADLLILAKTRSMAGGPLLTFDKRLAREDGAQSP